MLYHRDNQIFSWPFPISMQYIPSKNLCSASCPINFFFALLEGIPSCPQQPATTLYRQNTESSPQTGTFQIYVNLSDDLGFCFLPSFLTHFLSANAHQISCTFHSPTPKNNSFQRYACRSRWLHGLSSRCAAAPLFGLLVRIPPGAWLCLPCESYVLSGRGLRDGQITLTNVVCLYMIAKRQ